MTMIKAYRRSIPRASTVRLPVFAITSAAILLAASSIALSQEKQSNPAREPSANVKFVAGHSALNIPFDGAEKAIAHPASRRQSADS